MRFRTMPDFLMENLQRHWQNHSLGIYSVCSANRFVLTAAMKQALADHSGVLIESTSNQVDQFGGYSGMNPAQFAAFVHSIAREVHFPVDRIFLGGDHLGPNVWQNRRAAKALTFAGEQVNNYVQAGFRKIHLDTSMRCADDPAVLTPATIAQRAAQLCQVAEGISVLNNGYKPVYYVIGSEVPVPGGATEALSEIEPSAVESLQETIAETRAAFFERGLESAWERVIAVVVQPGVEFGNSLIVEYQREKAQPLSRAIEKYENLVYEAHSTDYQLPEKLKQMVEDHFAILKVGPALTFAFREAVFALADIEREILLRKKGVTLSNLKEVIDRAMMEKPEFWQKHYRGDAHSQALARKFSFSDRIRYYWPEPKVKTALDRLLKNLSPIEIPLSLLSQYLPVQYRRVREGKIRNNATSLILDKIMEITGSYAFATGVNKTEVPSANLTDSLHT